MTDHYVQQWRKARGMTQEQLADAISRTTASVSRIESGGQKLTEMTIGAIAKALGIQPGDIYRRPTSDEGGATSEAPPAVPSVRTRAEGMVLDNLVSADADLPIYTSAQGGPTGMTVNFGDPIEWVKRPEPLFNVRRGFGMYVVGDSMEPAYRHGDMILIHPTKPPTRGDDVLVILHNGDGQHNALVKTLLSADSDRVRLRQYNPADDFEVIRSTVAQICLIVGKYSRR